MLRTQNYTIGEVKRPACDTEAGRMKKREKYLHGSAGGGENNPTPRSRSRVTLVRIWDIREYDKNADLKKRGGKGEK